MNTAVSRASGIPAAIYALSVGSFGIGSTDFLL
jgi:DHA1 family inner membrane transport protein